jgi:hypothetical protein
VALWVVAGLALLVAALALLSTRRLSRRLDAMTQSYWELRYDYTRLRSQVSRLDPEQVDTRPSRPKPHTVGVSSHSFIKKNLDRFLQSTPDGCSAAEPAGFCRKQLGRWFYDQRLENPHDVVVIGSALAATWRRFVHSSAWTAVVERAPTLGGTCLNWGCIPTKALLEHAHALKIAQSGRTKSLRWPAAVGLDMAQVHAEGQDCRISTGGSFSQEAQDRLDQG